MKTKHKSETSWCPLLFLSLAVPSWQLPKEHRGPSARSSPAPWGTAQPPSPSQQSSQAALVLPWQRHCALQSSQDLKEWRISCSLAFPAAVLRGPFLKLGGKGQDLGSQEELTTGWVTPPQPRPAGTHGWATAARQGKVGAPRVSMPRWVLNLNEIPHSSQEVHTK